jgi:hypothetical protein
MIVIIERFYESRLKNSGARLENKKRDQDSWWVFREK